MLNQNSIEKPSTSNSADQASTSTSWRNPALLIETLNPIPCHRRVLTVYDLPLDSLKQLLKKVLNMHYGTDFFESLFDGFEIRQDPDLLELREIYYHDGWQVYWLTNCEYGEIEISSFCFDENSPQENFMAYAFCRRDYSFRHALQIPADCISSRH